MTQFIPSPRFHTYQDQARLRRFAMSFQQPGSEDGSSQTFMSGEGKILYTITPLPAANTIQDVIAVTVHNTDGTFPGMVTIGADNIVGSIRIQNVNGSTFWKSNEDGMEFKWVSDKIISANTDLDEDNMGRWTALNTTSSVALKMVKTAGSGPQQSDTRGPGAWFGFYDIGGNTDEFGVTIDPDNANTSFTINGSTITRSLLDSAYSGAILLYDYNDNDNWILLKIAGDQDSNVWGDVRNISANTTAAISDRTILVDASGGNRVVTLQPAAKFTSRQLTVKKIDNSGNSVTIDGDGAETIDNATTVAVSTQYHSRTITSNGTSYHIIGTFP